jgi:hypothetical protein
LEIFCQASVSRVSSARASDQNTNIEGKVKAVHKPSVAVHAIAKTGSFQI